MEVLVSLLAIAAFAGFAWLQRRHSRAGLQRAFEAREFDTPAGRLRGAELKVVRFRFEQQGGSEGSDGLRAGWWYCVGPGPSWLLVIGQDDAVSMTRVGMKRVVRELMRERMRGALAGDAAALRAAFGD